MLKRAITALLVAATAFMPVHPIVVYAQGSDLPPAGWGEPSIAVPIPDPLTINFQSEVRENVRDIAHWNLNEAERRYLGFQSINFREGYQYIWGIADERNNLVPHRTFYSDSQASEATRNRAQGSTEWMQILERGGTPRLELLFRLPLYRRMTMQELRQFITMYDNLGGATPTELGQFNQVNVVREYYGINPLEINRYMMIAARLYAYYMTIFGMSHNRGPYASVVGAWGGASGNVARAFGVVIPHADGGNSAQLGDAHTWRHSPGHREYMLHSGSSHGGIGTVGIFTYLFVGRDTPISAVTLYEASRLQEQGISRQEILGEHYLQIQLYEAFGRRRNPAEGDIEFLVMHLDETRLLNLMEGMAPTSNWLRDYWFRIVRGSGTSEDIAIVFQGNPNQSASMTRHMVDSNQRLAMELFLQHRLPHMSWE